jgi:hypothetical protein
MLKGKTLVQLIAAGILFLVAGALVFNWWRGGQAEAKAYFYDLSKGELFVANANLIPPIRGVDGVEEDGVKAVVITPKPEDKKNRRIAYLERYAPELKRDMEEARAKNSAPMIGRAGAQALRFVRREKDKEWYPLVSPEGQRIVSEWTAPGPDGLSPVVCTP